MGRRHVVATIVAATIVLLGCGSEAESPVARAPTAPAPTTSTTLPPCGVVTADMVTTALGEVATFLGTDASGCGYTAGQWSLGVRAEPYDPGTQGPVATGPMLDGVSVPHAAYLNNDRSGRWKVDGGLLVNDVYYTIFLLNGASGPDTYPGFDGPEQRPRTAAAAAALVNAISRAG